MTITTTQQPTPRNVTETANPTISPSTAELLERQDEVVLFQPNSGTTGNDEQHLPLAETFLLPSNYSSSYQLAYLPTDQDSGSPSLLQADNVKIVEDPNQQVSDNDDGNNAEEEQGNEPSRNRPLESSVPRPDFEAMKRRRQRLQASAATGGAVAGLFLGGPVGSVLLGYAAHGITKGVGRAREYKAARKYVRDVLEEREQRTAVAVPQETSSPQAENAILV